MSSFILKCKINPCVFIYDRLKQSQQTEESEWKMQELKSARSINHWAHSDRVNVESAKTIKQSLNERPSLHERVNNVLILSVSNKQQDIKIIWMNLTDTLQSYRAYDVHINVSTHMNTIHNSMMCAIKQCSSRNTNLSKSYKQTPVSHREWWEVCLCGGGVRQRTWRRGVERNRTVSIQSRHLVAWWPKYLPDAHDPFFIWSAQTLKLI